MDVITETNKAVEFVKQKDYKSAEKIYLKLVYENPDNSLLLSFLGFLYLTAKKYKKAETVFEKAYSLSQIPSIVSGLALSKFILQKYEESIFLYCGLVKAEPKYEYYEKLTTAIASLIKLGKSNYIKMGYEYAKEAYDKFPVSKEILLNLSVACIYGGKFKDGEKYCSDALKLDSKYAEAWNHQGIIQECLYCDEEGAQGCYKKAIKYNPKMASGYYDLGISYSKSCDYKKSLKAFKKALELLPENETVILGIAFNYFKQRKFKEGYKYYIKQNDSGDVRKLKKTWDGKPHKDKTIFIYPDLAYGDHIQFMRYVPFLKDRFKSVKVFAFPQLIELFKKSFDGIDFVDKFPKYDYSAALSKLPYYLKMDFGHIPFCEGYLKSDNISVKSDKLKVGVCWEAGNADLRNTIHRSININEFSELFNKDFDFYSFQVNPSSDDYKKYNLTDLGKNFKTFTDTALHLKSMDVLISVDTSVANLAGALGVKTFLLLPYYPDWRWFDNVEKTEWYNSIRIFKQIQKNSWKNEMARIILELTKLSEKC